MIQVEIKSVFVTIEGKQYELSAADARQLRDQLAEKLGEKPLQVYCPPYSPGWWGIYPPHTMPFGGAPVTSAGAGGIEITTTAGEAARIVATGLKQESGKRAVYQVMKEASRNGGI